MLNKGDACLQCRQDKKKCDGLRGGCSRCRQLRKRCAFALSIARRQGTIDALQGRILELELKIRKLVVASTHDRPLSSGKLLQRIKRLGIPDAHIATNTPSWLTAYPGIESHKPQKNISAVRCDHMVQRVLVEHELELSQPAGNEDLPPPLSRRLISLFLPYRCQFFLNMDVSYFLECFSLPSTHPESIHPCLLNACYLGACVIGGGSMASFQPLFVERTRYFLSQALMFADRISHFLWASIVLSWYFTRLRRLEEASTVISPGAHLATACGLGQLDGVKANDPSGDSLWRPPRNEREATDRIHLSYSFYIVDQVFSLISGYRATFAGNPHWGSAIELAQLQCQLAQDAKTKTGTLSLWHSGEHLVAAVLKILQEVRDFALTKLETARTNERMNS